MGNTKGLSAVQRHALVALVAQIGTSLSLKLRFGIDGRTLDSLVRRGLIACPTRLPGLAETYRLTPAGYLFALAQRRREEARMPLADVANPWSGTILSDKEMATLEAIDVHPARTPSELFLRGFDMAVIYSLKRAAFVDIAYRGEGGGLTVSVSESGRAVLAGGRVSEEGGAR